MKERKKSIMKKLSPVKKPAFQVKKAIKKIAYDDIPETNEEFWSSADIHVPRKKEMITMRLDPEVIDYFKHSGKGYQTKINAILKSYVRHHPKQANL